MWEFRVTGHYVAARVASRLEMGLQAIQQTETLNQLISHNVWKQKKNYYTLTKPNGTTFLV